MLRRFADWCAPPVAGALAALAFPPVDAGVLIVVGLAWGFGLARRAASAGGALLGGFGLGLGYFAIAAVWSARFGVLVWLLLAVLQAVFWAPAAWVAWSVRQRSASMAVIASTAAFTVVEAARARIPMGGFEWAQAGVAAAGSPVRSAAAVVGTLGVTALVVGAAAALAIAAERPRAAVSWAPLGVVASIVAALVLIGSAPWTRTVGELEVAVLQVAAPCPGQASVDCPNEREWLLRELAHASTNLDAEVDLIVWGEGTLRSMTEPAAGQALVDAAGVLPAPVMAGLTTPVGADGFLNRNVLIDVDGSVLDSYAKRHPVPFGEYVPARSVLGGIREVGRLVPRDMVRGSDPGLLTLGETTLGTVSSWEVTFSRLVQDVGIDGHALVVLTTQATYEEASVSDQLLRSAQMRAAELHRSTIVAATTGRSAAIAPDGALVQVTQLYDADELIASVELRTGATPFARFGDVPVLVLAAAGMWTAGVWSSRRPSS